jgi:DTW domain-containing protein
MSRRDNRERRCSRCRLHQTLCICALIPRIETRTRLVVFVHRREHKKPTNTGRLATLCLPNSEVVVRGEATPGLLAFPPEPGRLQLLLFPDEGATPLAGLATPDRPVTLVVPDGNWRQAARMRKRIPGLSDLTCVSLPGDRPSPYPLRSETHPQGLSTLEAIARAMGILEGQEVQRALERALELMASRTLWARGTLATADVPGGIPEGVMRHDPSLRQ